MKKLITLLMMFIMLVACSPSEEPIELEKIKPVETYKSTDATIIGQSGIDINNDGIEDIITLKTEAGIDEEGNMMWDDGQKWELTVAMPISDLETKTYVLIDEYVQLGTLQYFVYYTDDDLNIAVVDERTANFSLDIYTYNIDTEEFIKKEVYNADGNVNMFYKSK